jgi:hypothetical protein
MALTTEVHKLTNIVDGAATPDDVARIVRCIQRTVEPRSWDVAGGMGTIVAAKPVFDDLWRLVILSEHHTAIATLITDLTS